MARFVRMMEQERKKPAIRVRTYSIAELYSIVELMLLRVVKDNPGLTCVEVHERMQKLVQDAKVHGDLKPMIYLDNITFALARAGHIGDVDWADDDDDDYGHEYNESDRPVITKKGRAYMLSMPKTVQNAATRIMSPYTILDRFAAAIPSTTNETRKKARKKAQRKARKNRRGRS